MNIRFKLFSTLLIATILFTSCSDDDTVVDSRQPEIEILEPHSEAEIAPGNELHFKALFTDNVELASYKIEIHDDFDEHDHAINKSSHDENPWSYDQTFTIPAGQVSFAAEQHIDIPAEINGMPISEGAYHLGVYVTDRSGNQQEAFVEIHIEEHSEEHTH